MWTVKPQIVLGGPGTGKTTYAMGVVEKLLGDGYKPHEVAFVSYTKKAVEEAKERAAASLGLSRRGMNNFRTVHSLCYRETGANRNNIMTPADYRELAGMLGMRYRNRRTDDSELPSADGSIDPHLLLHGYARARMTSDRDAWEMVQPEFGWWEHERVISTLREYKLDNGKRDFNDLLTDYLDHAEPMAVRAAIIDEAQDLSTVQWEVVKKAFAGVEQLYIAGDDDQAIYRWNGADVDQFVQLSGQEYVLPVSHRLPRAVFDEAQHLVKTIGKRRAKEYGHTGKAGHVEWLVHPDELPIDANSGTWMLLARNKYQLGAYREACKVSGIPYRTATGTSFDDEHISAIVGWERMRKGKEIDATMAASVRYCLGVHGPDSLPDKETYSREDFAAHGCTESRIWHDALFGISAQDTAYYLNVLRNGFSITKPPPVYIGTIHSAKGGEADNVALLTDVSGKSAEALRNAPDDETRVFYVAITRAKSALYLITPQTDKFFPL